MFRVARKIKVGRETGNTHIFFFGLRTRKLNEKSQGSVTITARGKEKDKM